MTEKTSKKAYKGSGANPIKSTIETIPNYPKKLIIFKVESSPYYWSRVYVNGRYSVRSLKTDNRKLAQKAAIKFFTDILVDHRVGVANPLKSRTFTNVGNDYLETASFTSLPGPLTGVVVGAFTAAGAVRRSAKPCETAESGPPLNGKSRITSPLNAGT